MNVTCVTAFAADLLSTPLYVVCAVSRRISLEVVMKNSRRYFVALVSVVSFFCLSNIQLLSAQQTEAVKDKAAAVVVAEPQAASQSVSAPSEVVPALPVPRLIKVSGVAKEPSGQPRLGAVGLTFAIYKDQEGGAALWMETQNAELDAQGRYSVLLGSTQNEGMPLELFATGEPRWLGVQVQLPGEVEQPRVLLVSVPYALKASDADTVGGLPASSFILAPTGSGSGASAGAVAGSSGSAKSNAAKPDASKEITSSGTTNYIPVFTDSSGDLGNSTITEVNGNVGIGWTTPLTKLVIAAPTGGGAINGSNLVDQDMWVTLTAPGASDKYAFFGPSTATNLTLGVGLKEMMRITSAGNVGIGYKNPTSRLVIGAPSGGSIINASNLVDQDMWIELSPPGASDKRTFFGPSTPTNLTLGVGLGEMMRITNTGNVGIGTSSPAQKLSVAGIIQSTSGGVMFPDGTTQTTASAGGGGGGVTSITAGTGLTGGTITTSGTIAINTSVVPLLSSANTFSNSQTINGNLSVLDTVTGFGGTFEGVNGGVMGWDTAVNDSSEVHYGTQGFASNSYGVGVAGQAYEGTGVHLGFGDASGGVGVFGTGHYGVYGYAGPLIANGETGVVGVGNTWGVFASGNMGASGLKPAVVPLPDNRVVALYAMESPEVWFEDLGSATLQDGVAVIALERTFALTVNTTVPYHVYVTPEGDCEGLYVTNKTPNSFEVRELRGGTSNVAFEYRIIAKRSGYEGVRIEQLQADAETIQAMREQSRHRPTLVPSIKVTKGGPVRKIISPQAKP